VRGHGVAGHRRDLLRDERLLDLPRRRLVRLELRLADQLGRERGVRDAVAQQVSPAMARLIASPFAVRLGPPPIERMVAAQMAQPWRKMPLQAAMRLTVDISRVQS